MAKRILILRLMSERLVRMQLAFYHALVSRWVLGAFLLPVFLSVALRGLCSPAHCLFQTGVDDPVLGLQALASISVFPTPRVPFVFLRAISFPYLSVMD